METFIVELVSSASCNVYPDNTFASFTNLLPEQLNLQGDWEVALLEITYPALYNNITEGNFCYASDKKDDTGSCLDIVHIRPGLYLSVDEILIAMNDAVKESRRDDEVNLKWRTDNLSQQVEISLQSEDSKFVVYSQDLSSILGFHKNEALTGKGPHTSIYPIDILRIHSVMVYTDIVQHTIVGDTRAPILRCFPFTQKVNRGSISITKYVNYSSFDNLQFRKLLKNSIHSIKIDIRAQTGELIPFASIGLTRLSLLFRRVQ